jgi:acetyl-CoA C-acetyltransferase
VKPRTVYQLPYFERYGAAPGEGTHSAEQFADGDELARALDLDRGKLDAYALRSHLKAYLAHKAKRFAGEIVPLRAEPSEAADESPDGDLAADELADLPAFDEQNGFLSPGNVSHLHDGAAVALVVAESVWRDLGTKPALAISASASRGIVSGRGSIAASAAVAALPPCVRSSAALYETSEASAAEALGLCHDLELGDELLNVEGGAIARGHPGGASGAVIVTRLYALLLRHYRSEFPKRAIAVQSALGGQATAVAFEVA